MSLKKPEEIELNTIANSPDRKQKKAIIGEASNLNKRLTTIPETPLYNLGPVPNHAPRPASSVYSTPDDAVPPKPSTYPITQAERDEDDIEIRTRKWSMARLRNELRYRKISTVGDENQVRQRVVKAHDHDERDGWVWSARSGAFYKIVPFAEGQGVDPTTVIGRHLYGVTRHQDGTLTLGFEGFENHKAHVSPPEVAKLFCSLIKFPRTEWWEGELKMVTDARVMDFMCVRENAATTIRTVGMVFDDSGVWEFIRCWRDQGIEPERPENVYLVPIWGTLDK